MVNVIIGGTFDHLHAGHKELLNTAMGVVAGDKLLVGLASDDFVKGKSLSNLIQPYAVRKSAIDQFLISVKHDIVELNDRWGITLITKDYDCIVVAKDTVASTEYINKIRKLNGLKEMLVVVAPTIYDDAGPISSTRIRSNL